LINQDFCFHGIYLLCLFPIKINKFLEVNFNGKTYFDIGASKIPLCISPRGENLMLKLMFCN